MVAYNAVNTSRNLLCQEALKDKVPSASLNRLRIEYDILLSPSYRVPVLYFRIRDRCTQPVTDVDVVYDCHVPPVYREQLHDVGIIGGISMAVSCS
jgi:ubiquitin-like-conjugating enzyme ATG10